MRRNVLLRSTSALALIVLGLSFATAGVAAGNHQTKTSTARAGQSESFDLRFGDQGREFVTFARRPTATQDARAMVLDSRGRTVIVGGDSQVGGRYSYIARLLPSGRLDPTFSGDGRKPLGLGYVPCRGPGNCVVYSTGGSTLNAVATDSKGRIIVAGAAARDGRGLVVVIARLTSRGLLDPTFSQDGRVALALAPRGGLNSAGATGISLTADGRIVVAGYSPGGPFVLRFNADGTLDDTFSSDGAVSLADLPEPKLCKDPSVGDSPSVAAQADGKILLTGNAHGCVVRLERDGSPDAQFGTDGFFVSTQSVDGGLEPRALALQSDGSIVVDGIVRSASAPSFGLERLTPNGSVDAAFGEAGLTTFSASIGDANSVPVAGSLALGPDRKIVMGAAIFDFRKQRAVEVTARLLPSGVLDKSFGTGGKRLFNFGPQHASSASYFGEQRPYRTSVAVRPRGSIVVAGGWFRGPDRLDFAVAQLVG